LLRDEAAPGFIRDEVPPRDDPYGYDFTFPDEWPPIDVFGLEWGESIAPFVPPE
jgi:hypothetical protein